MEDGQKTPRGHPDFNSYVQILRVFIDNGQMNRQTDGDINLVWASLTTFLQVKINETQLSWKQQSCQKCKHRQSHFDFLNNAYWVLHFRETTRQPRYVSRQVEIGDELQYSFNTTALQSRQFLKKYRDLLQPYSNNRFSKNIENFLCKQKIVNNCSIPSTHAERQITDLSN